MKNLKRFKLEKFNRIKSKKLFQAVYKNGHSVVDTLSVLYILPSETTTVKIGLAVGKKVGNAVVRNHAGVEAALSAARLGGRTLLATLSMDNIALMPCNPSVGGSAKGHLVREVDALGGQMGIAADEACIQMRLLNTGKGYAVHGRG